MPTKTQARGYLIVLGISIVCWILGLVLPMIYVRPYPEFITVGIEPYEKSTWATIVMLFVKRYYFGAVLMCFCSIVIPFCKCVGLLFILAFYMGWMPTRGGKGGKFIADQWPSDLTRLIALFSGYQFVDIFVGLLFLAFCNTPEVHSCLLAGYYFFLAYCLLSTFVVHALLDEDMQLSSQMWKVEVNAVRGNLLALIFLFVLGFGEPMLDVAYTFQGMAMGRSRMGLLGMTYQLSKFAHPILGMFFIAITVVIPVILGITYLLAADYFSVMRQREAMTFGNHLQKFAMTDVFCLALIIFLFSVQGTHVTSSVPNGTFFSLFYTEWLSGFYVALGYGAAVFTLKWRALSPQTDETSIARYYGLPIHSIALYQSQNGEGGIMTQSDLGDPLTGPLSMQDLRHIPMGDFSPGHKMVTIAESPASKDDDEDAPPEESKVAKLMKNPVFHIKLTSWIIWGICYFGIRAPPPLTFMSVNAAVNHMLPVINDAIGKSLPTSVGSCNDTEVPQPCLGDGPLYNSTSGSTKVTVRWATGLNTIQLNHVAIQLIPDSQFPIQMQIQGVLKSLSASIKVENCIIGCQTLWDNKDGCCGENRNFDLVVASNCVDQESSFSAASLGEFKVEWFSIESMVVSENVLGVDVSLTDITPAVESAVRGFLTDYLQGNKSIAQHGKKSFTFTDAVQRVWEYNINERRLKCKEMLEQL